MSYQVLARKWRPKNFSQLMGQKHVVNVLANALEQQRLHHAYLFTGTRGVGKTTIARIFAKSLNCEQGITREPCGQCDICLDIDAGRFVDLLEIDAASRTKVDDTREILDNVQYAPSRGRYKVYLIDEVHMLSRSSFNALLKTLEEPPPHVKFILATTDPQKLPVTVLSRCLQFHLKALTRAQIEEKLQEILTAEHVDYENSAISLLAKAARGSMRDSLSLTDQAIAQGQGNIQLANVQAMLGSIDHQWSYKLVVALLKKDNQGLMALSKQIASFSPNYHRLLAELIQLFHQIALWQLVPNATDVDPEQSRYIEQFASAMSPEDVQLYYQIALNGRKDLPYSGDEQAGFDMVLLRLMAFAPSLGQNLPQSNQVTASPTNLNFDELESQPLNQTQQSNSPEQVNSHEQTNSPEQSSKPQQHVATAEGLSQHQQSNPEIEFTGHTELKENDQGNNTPLVSNSSQTLTEEEQEPSTYEQVKHLVDDMFSDGSSDNNESRQFIAPEEQSIDKATEFALKTDTETEPESKFDTEFKPELDVEPRIDSEEFVQKLDLEQQSLEAEAIQDGLMPEPVIEEPQPAEVEQPTQVAHTEEARTELAQPPQTQSQAETASPVSQNSALASVLSQRNMLRSQKQLLEGSGKKSQPASKKTEQQAKQKPDSPLRRMAQQGLTQEVDSPVNAQNETTQEAKAQPNEVARQVERQSFNQETSLNNIAPPASHSHQQTVSERVEPEKNQSEQFAGSNQVEPKDIQPSQPPQAKSHAFDVNSIEPLTTKSATQVDLWAYMIDAMDLRGRLRQLAQCSELVEINDDNVCTLSIPNSAQHLTSQTAYDSLAKSISLYEQKPIEIQVNWVENTAHSPQVIQQQIEQHRHANAVNIIHHDSTVNKLLTVFDATVNEDSIEAL